MKILTHGFRTGGPSGFPTGWGGPDGNGRVSGRDELFWSTGTCTFVCDVCLSIVPNHEAYLQGDTGGHMRCVLAVEGQD